MLFLNSQLLKFAINVSEQFSRVKTALAISCFILSDNQKMENVAKSLIQRWCGGEGSENLLIVQSCRIQARAQSIKS